MYLGAVLSIVDTLTDFDAIYLFFKHGNTNFAWANLAFISISLFLQLLVVVVQNKKRGNQAKAYEGLIVLFMLKPAVDARRIASGNVQVENSLVDPETEHTFAKCIVMFSESIPFSVLQSYAVVGSNEHPGRAMASIFISALSIGYASSVISMSWDTNPSKRSISPSFYGYFPDDGRLNVMILMIIITTIHVLMKVLACSLMLRLNKVWFWFYACGDMGLYFLLKIIRGDCRYWLNLRGGWSWPISIAERIVSKVICDFTLLIHFRHRKYLLRPLLL